jgi:hypothetical protein
MRLASESTWQRWREGVWVRALLFIFLLARAASASGDPDHSPWPRKFVVISDLHFTGETNENESFTKRVRNAEKFGDDSNGTLIASVLKSILSNCPDPLFVLVQGDILAHDIRRVQSANFETADKYVVQQFRDHQLTNAFVALGNNDAPHGQDYAAPDEPLLMGLIDDWTPLLRPENQSDFKTLINNQGCYSTDLPGLTNHTLIVFNSTLFTKRFLAQPAANKGLAGQQWDWLTNAIQRATNKSIHQKIWLSFHVPPGIDPFSTIIVGKPIMSLWDDTIQNQFLGLLARMPQITASFAGHTHRDEFRIVKHGHDPVAFIHISPSVSPIYHNNPAYQIFTVAANGDLLDCETFRLKDVPQINRGNDNWTREYSFRETYEAEKYDLENLIKLQTKLTDEKWALLYKYFYVVGSPDAEYLFGDNPGKPSYWSLMELNFPEDANSRSR